MARRKKIRKGDHSAGLIKKVRNDPILFTAVRSLLREAGIRPRVSKKLIEAMASEL